MKITTKRKCLASSNNLADNHSSDYNLELGPGDIIVSNLTGVRFKILKPQNGYVLVINLDDGIISHISNDSLNKEIFHLESSDDEITAARNFKDTGDPYPTGMGEGTVRLANNYKTWQDVYSLFIEVANNSNDEDIESEVYKIYQKGKGLPQFEKAYSVWMNSDNNEEGQWEEVASKQVMDSDGFLTDYTMYTDGETYICMFGDKDIYEPDAEYADYETENEKNAWDWFNTYEGFADDFEADEDYDIYSAQEVDDTSDELVHPDQEFDSAETSINSNKLPAIYRMISIPEGTVGIDFGGGKWDNTVEHVRDLGATLCVYDPYNRSAEHNKEVIRTLRANGGADWAINSNVLNVIKEPEARRAVLENISKITKPGAPIYITVYEGRGDGNEGQTKSGYQLNRKTQDYLDDIREVFPDASRRGKLITAHNTRAASACITTSENMDKIEGVDFRPAIIGICDGIHDVVYAELTNIMTSPEFGFESDEVDGYIRVDTRLQHEWLIVEIGAEVDFDGLSEICEKLTKVIAEYDPEAYFEPVDPGIAEAYLNTDTLLNNRNRHDVFSAVDSELSARNVVHVGNATFSVYYNKIDNSPEADPDIMFDTFKAKVGRLSPYDDANYAWANIHDGKIDIIRDGKIIDTSYYFNADDMDVENIEWCDAVVDQAVDALIEFDKDTQPRIITNSTELVESAQNYGGAYAENIAAPTDGYVSTYCDNCGKKNSVKVSFKDYKSPFDDTEYDCKYCGARNLLTDPHRFDDDGKVIESARDYGGAYDIDPSQYFTRDDLDEFAQDVVDAINGEGYSKVELISSFIDDGKVEITLDWDGNEVSSAIKIDMRRILKPSDIRKYLQPMCAALLGKLAPIGFDYGPHFNGEDYPLRGSTDVMSYVELDPEEREGPKARPDEERVITIDGYQAELVVADDGSYVIPNDNLVDRANDIADVNDLILSGGRYHKVWGDRTYHTELFDSVDVADAVSDVIADDVPEDPGKYKLDCDIELTYTITDIATFDVDDPDRFDFDRIKSNLKRAEVFNVKISPIE